MVYTSCRWRRWRKKGTLLNHCSSFQVYVILASLAHSTLSLFQLFSSSWRFLSLHFDRFSPLFLTLSLSLCWPYYSSYSGSSSSSSSWFCYSLYSVLSLVLFWIYYYLNVDVITHRSLFYHSPYPDLIISLILAFHSLYTEPITPLILTLPLLLYRPYHILTFLTYPSFVTPLYRPYHCLAFLFIPTLPFQLCWPYHTSYPDLFIPLLLN